MKKAVLYSLIFFGMFSLFVIVGGKLSRNTNSNVQNAGSSGSTSITGDMQNALTAQVVAQHSTQSDCWMIIEGKVYDLTGYFGLHPGGNAELLKYCGQDGTKGFQIKDEFTNQDHSAQARALLPSYFIGNLNDSLVTTQADITTAQSDTAVTESGGMNTGTGQQGNTTVNNIVTNTPSALPGTGQTTSGINAASLAAHSKASDCWMVIEGKVYDLTSYFGQHPGGDMSLADYCGKDGTTAYNTKNGSGHSDYANSLLAAYYIGNYGTIITSPTAPNQDQPVTNSQTVVTPSPPAIIEPAPAPVVEAPAVPVNIALTAAEVAKHNSSADCWSIFNNKVYNLTSYFGSHPGGNGNLSQACGVDGTAAYNAIGHSGNASNLLASYYIGDLNASVAASETVSSTGTSSAPTSYSGEYEDDYYEQEYEDDDKYEDD